MSAADEVVIIGVGQLRNNRERDVAQAREPIELIVDAARSAAADAGLADLTGVDLIDVVQIVSWSYDDAASLLAKRLDAPHAEGTVSGVGGHQPVARLQALADRLSRGEGRLGLLVGGEAQSSLELLEKQGVENPWSRGPGGFASFPREVGGTERMWDLALVAPIRVYPLYENRLRHDLGQTFTEAQQWSARMYARFSEQAATNDAAWNTTTLTPDEISTVTEQNRMICFPYPLRMNANNRVDQAAAVLVATVAAADELGVPEERRIHVRSAAGATDSEDVLERTSYGASPGLEHTLDRTLEQAGVSAAELDVLDLYSCFPVVPKLAALHLGLSDEPLSVTGGLSSFGGAHNDYSTHALVATVRALRERGGLGLVYANGEYLTKHAAVVLASASNGEPPVLSAPVDDPPGPPAPTFVDGYVGPADIETHTVEYGRDGVPARAYVIARTPAGDRAAARVSKSDAATLAVLVSTDTDPIGAPGRIERSGEHRVFVAGSTER